MESISSQSEPPSGSGGRTSMAEAGFPPCHPTHQSSMGQTNFAFGLLPLGHGYPLLQPTALGVLEPSHPNGTGLTLGDVGFLDDIGFFVLHFNIFGRPTQLGRLPEYFEPITPPLSEWKVNRQAGYFPPDTAIVGQGVQSQRISETPLKFEFKATGHRGSILILPDGASREDLVDIDALYPYIEKHALDWYRFFNGYSRNSAIVQNGTIYLITGIDYAPSWATAMFKRDGGSQERTVSFDGSQGRSYACWQPGLTMAPCFSSEGPQKDAVILRGLRIALGSAVWAKYYGNVPVHSHFVSLRPKETEPGASKYHPWLSKLQRRLSKGNPSQKGDAHAIAVSDLTPFHPSTLALQVMLAKAPSANSLAIHDSVWSTLNSLVPLWHDTLLDEIIRIFQEYDVQIKQGIAVLVPRQVDRSQPMGKVITKRILRPLASVVGHGSPQQHRLAVWKHIRQLSPSDD